MTYAMLVLTAWGVIVVLMYHLTTKPRHGVSPTAQAPAFAAKTTTRPKSDPARRPGKHWTSTLWPAWPCGEDRDLTTTAAAAAAAAAEAEAEEKTTLTATTTRRQASRRKEHHPVSALPPPPPTHTAAAAKAATTRPSYDPPWRCSGCFDWSSSYQPVINQRGLCRSGRAPDRRAIDLIFLVPSVHHKAAQRTAIRQTWASVTANNTSNFRHVFLFGASRHPARMRVVEEESRRFRDVVVMAGFQDSYRNLTVKTMVSLRWLTETCPQAR